MHSLIFDGCGGLLKLFTGNVGREKESERERECRDVYKDAWAREREDQGWRRSG